VWFSSVVSGVSGTASAPPVADWTLSKLDPASETCPDGVDSSGCSLAGFSRRSCRSPLVDSRARSNMPMR
jgi:hypothetical protein